MQPWQIDALVRESTRKAAPPRIVLPDGTDVSVGKSKNAVEEWRIIPRKRNIQPLPHAHTIVEQNDSRVVAPTNYLQVDRVYKPGKSRKLDYSLTKAPEIMYRAKPKEVPYDTFRRKHPTKMFVPACESKHLDANPMAKTVLIFKQQDAGFFQYMPTGKKRLDYSDYVPRAFKMGLVQEKSFFEKKMKAKARKEQKQTQQQRPGARKLHTSMGIIRPPLTQPPCLAAAQTKRSASTRKNNIHINNHRTANNNNNPNNIFVDSISNNVHLEDQDKDEILQTLFKDQGRVGSAPRYHQRDYIDDYTDAEGYPATAPPDTQPKKGGQTVLTTKTISTSEEDDDGDSRPIPKYYANALSAKVMSVDPTTDPWVLARPASRHEQQQVRREHERKQEHQLRQLQQLTLSTQRSTTITSASTPTTTKGTGEGGNHGGVVMEKQLLRQFRSRKEKADAVVRHRLERNIFDAPDRTQGVVNIPGACRDGEVRVGGALFLETEAALVPLIHETVAVYMDDRRVARRKVFVGYNDRGECVFVQKPVSAHSRTTRHDSTAAAAAASASVSVSAANSYASHGKG